MYQEGTVLKITRLTLELLQIEEEKKALYAREKEVKENLRVAYEQIKVKTREGLTIDQIEGENND